MKVLIVMSGGFDTYGPSRHLYHALIEDLLLNGITVHLIESHTTGKDPDVPEEFLKYKTFSYDIVPGKIVEKRAFVKRYLAGLKYTHDCKKKLNKCKNRFDLALVQSCVWAPFMIPLVKKATNAKVVWNIQDMFPGASIANGVMKSRFLIWLFYKLHKRAYKYADHITVISEDMERKVIEQGYNKKSISVIYDWFDDSTVEEVEWNNNLFVKKYNLDKDKFYVQYAGTMGFNFDYRVVIEVASILLDNENIVFQMVGFGSQLDSFKAEVKNRGLRNVEFLPIQEQQMVKHVYSACSVCIIPLPLGVIGNSVPSKIGLLMACKRPVITTADNDSFYLKMVNDNNFGFAFGTTQYEEVAKSILELYNNHDLCVKMGKNGFEYGHIIYSRTFNTQKYVRLFNNIVEAADNEEQQ